ncbi:MAG: type II toxin-antitoxin system ParD family antitoxin [Pseudomonadota bacterium]
MPKDIFAKLGEHEALHQALIDGETSGPSEAFDRKAFQAEMRAKHARPRQPLKGHADSARRS